MHTRAYLRNAGRLGGVVALLGLVGCKSLGIDGQPDELQVDVEAVGASDVVVVTSTHFTFVTNPNCESGQQCDQSLMVLSADTTTVGVPYHHTYAFTTARKYLVEVYPTGGLQATVSMRVRIDGKDWYDDARELHPVGDNGEQETLLFTYAFSKPGAS